MLSARTETLTPVDASAAKRQAVSLSSSEQRFAHMLPRKLNIWISFATNIAATPSWDVCQAVSHSIVRASIKPRCSNHRGSDCGVKLRRVCYKNVLPCFNNRRTQTARNKKSQELEVNSLRCFFPSHCNKGTSEPQDLAPHLIGLQDLKAELRFGNANTSTIT